MSRLPALGGPKLKKKRAKKILNPFLFFCIQLLNNLIKKGNYVRTLKQRNFFKEGFRL